MNFDRLLPQILDLAALDKKALDAVAMATAKLSFYDWLVVSCAGSTEPLANILRDFIASEGGAAIASEGHRVPAARTDSARARCGGRPDPRFLACAGLLLLLATCPTLA